MIKTWQERHSESGHPGGWVPLMQQEIDDLREANAVLLRAIDSLEAEADRHRRGDGYWLRQTRNPARDGEAEDQYSAP